VGARGPGPFSAPDGRRRASEHLKNADRLLKVSDIDSKRLLIRVEEGKKNEGSLKVISVIAFVAGLLVTVTSLVFAMCPRRKRKRCLRIVDRLGGLIPWMANACMTMS
jgi:hypothetical protein